MAGRAGICFGLLLVLAGAGGCVTQHQLRLAGAYSDTPRPLWEIHFEGNHRFKDSQIRARLASVVTDYRSVHYYDADLFQDDLRRVVALYKAHGYFATRITDTRYYEWEGRQLVIIVSLDEGPVTRWRNVEVHGAEATGVSLSLGLSRGAAFDHPAYLAAKDILAKRLRQAGYAHAEVAGKVVVDPVDLAADVTFETKPGERAQVGEVAITGPNGPLSPKDEHVVRALSTFGRGDRYDEDELNETQNRLYTTGAFARVEVDPDLDQKTRDVPVTIRATLGREHAVRFGVGIGADRYQHETRTSISWINRDYGGGLKTLEFYGRVAYAWLPSVFDPITQGIVGEAGVRATQPAKTNALLDFNQGVSVDSQLVEEYRSYGVKPEVGLAKVFWKRQRKVTLGLAYKAEGRFFSFFTNIPPYLENEVGVQDRFLLSYLEPSLVYDSRNDPFDPTRGIYAALITDHSVGGTYGFDKFVPELRGYYPLLGRYLVISGKLKVGTIVQRKSGELVHVSQRFFAGGASSHRGFGYRLMSPPLINPATQKPYIDPRTNTEFLKGGLTLVESSLELRSTPWVFPLGGTPAGFGGVVFIDAGRVGDAGPSDFSSVGMLEYAIGWGLRFDTIAGPLRFDVGYRIGDLLKNQLDQPPVAVHFSFGQAF